MEASGYGVDVGNGDGDGDGNMGDGGRYGDELLATLPSLNPLRETGKQLLRWQRSE